MHDEEGCPLYRVSTTSHDSLCLWLMPVVEFARLSLGEEVTPVLFFDRGGAYPETMAELRDARAEFVTYERRRYGDIGATEFRESISITLPSQPHRPTRISWVEAPQKNLRCGRGRVRRIALLMPDGAQVNLLAVSDLPAPALIRGQLARWGVQENQLKHGVERWGINQLDGRRVEEYPPDALIPNPSALTGNDPGLLARNGPPAGPRVGLVRRLHVGEVGADQVSLARATVQLLSASHRLCGGVKGTLATRGGYAALDPVLGLWRTAKVRAARAAR